MDTKLVIVTAPAGYGKTSLLVDTANTHGLPHCWYTLDELDQDLPRFLSHLAASIEKHFPAFRQSANTVQRAATQGGYLPEQLASLCADEIYRTIREHFVIVLDDYHRVDASQAVSAFINRFIQDADENCHLVILSRQLVQLVDLPLMVARTQVGGLGFQELSFRPDEIQALMLQNYNQVIPTSMADDLAQETEGWITALLLSAQTMWQGMTDRIRTSRVSGVGLYEYLAHQVLDQQPPELRDFLLRSSLFEEFDAGLCEAVLGPPADGESWQGMLDKILQHNLFVLPIGEEKTWLRYHHLFRDFLQNQLSREEPEEKIQIQRALAAVYITRREWERAYAIYQRLNDTAATADLLEQAGEMMVKSGQVARLAEWIDALPPAIMATRPALLARRGVAATALGETQRGLSLLDKAVADFRAADNTERLAGTLVWRAWVQFNLSNHSASLEDASETLSLAEQDNIPIEFRAEALRIRGLNLRMLGNLGEAIPNFSESLDLYYQQDDPSSVTLVSMALGATYMDSGELGSAMACYKSAIDYYRKENDLYSSSVALNDLAVLHYLRGEYRQASVVFDDALARARQSKNSRVEMLVLAGLGDLFIDLDAFQAAEDAYQQARELAHQLKHQFMLLYLYLAEAALARIRGEFKLSHQLLSAAGQAAGQNQSKYAQALYWVGVGQLARVENNFPSAAALLMDAARTFESGGQRVEGAKAYLHLAMTSFESGDLEMAANSMGDAFSLVKSLESQYVLVPPGRQVKPLLEALVDQPEIGGQVRRLSEQIDQFEKDLPSLRRHLRRKKTSITLAAPHLRIQALGKARVRKNNKFVTSADWQTQVTRDLFFLILNTGDTRPVFPDPFQAPRLAKRSYW